MISFKHVYTMLLFSYSCLNGLIACKKSVIVEMEPEETRDGFVIAQWNIGHYNFGKTQNSNITPDSFAGQYLLYQQMLSSINADLLAICEYSAVFGTDSSGERGSLSTLFSSYPYYFEGHQANYACNALFSQEKLENIESHSFENLKTKYYYISADFPYGGITIKVISTHLAFNDVNDDYALSQIKELIEIAKDYKYVVMMGDWNIKDVNNYSLFVDAGYALANHGRFGDFETFSRKKAANARNYILDNIMVKGLTISDVRVIKQDLSDHYPLIASVALD